MKTLKTSFYLLVAMFFGIQTTQGATIIVSNTNDSGLGSLRFSLDISNQGDSIRFDPSLIAGGSATINLNSQLQPTNHEFTLTGLYNANDTLYISGGNSTRLFEISNPTSANIVMDSLVMIDGQALQGGAVFVSDGTFIFKNCIFRNNQTTGIGGRGGVIYAESSISVIQIIDCIAESNVSSRHGGFIYTLDATITMSGSLFMDNEAIRNGGVVSMEYFGFSNSLNVTNCQFINNSAGLEDGGAIFTDRPCVIDSCVFDGNSSTSGSGGAVSTQGSCDSLVISNSSFKNNTAYSGSAVLSFAGEDRYTNSTFNGNSGQLQTINTMRLAMTNCTCINNSNFGTTETIRAQGAPNSITNCTIFNNNPNGYPRVTELNGSTTVQGSIIAFNGSAVNPNSSYTSLGNNVFSGLTGNQIASDQVAANQTAINLGPLGNNGGFTETVVPIGPSIAIEMGNPSDLSDAQNRPIIGIRDVGAAESCTEYTYISEQGCDTYLWVAGDGNTYTSDTVVSYVLPTPTVNGCDSILVLDLQLGVSPQDYSVSTAQTQFCDSASTTIDLGSSQTDIKYYLRDDANDSIVAGPVDGTGAGLSFNTGNINQTTTYNVHAKNLSGGLDFDGADDYIENSSVTLNPLDGFTLESWINIDNITDFQGIISNTNGNVPAPFDTYVNGTTGVITFCVGNGSLNNCFTTPNSLNPGQWYHVAFVYDAGSSQVKIYLDGTIVLNGNVTVPVVQSASNFRVGSRADDYTTYDGKMDNVRVWGNARTTNEILQSMHTCLTGSEPDLVLAYQFEDGAGSGTAEDASTNSFAGMLTNMDNTNAWVDGTDLCSSCNLEMSQTVTITINNSNTSTISATGCGSYTVPSGDETYTMSGTYMDTISNVVGCDSVITINLNVLNSTSATISATACDSYTVPSGDETYTMSGTYMDTIPNLAGCDSIMTINLTVNTVNVSVTNNAPTLTADAIAVYQWIDCGNGNMLISGETSQNFTAISNGDYAVIITENGCTDTSACETVNNVGLEDLESVNAHIYPNPNNGQFTVGFSGQTSYDDMTISIINILGKEVYKFKPNSAISAVDVSHLDNGIYTVKIQYHNQQSVFKVVIQ